eukprot:11103_1
MSSQQSFLSTINNPDDVYKRTLHELVSSADNVEQLTPILQTYSLNDLKQYIYQQIDASSMKSRKYSYFNACDIGQIVGEDIMQYIISFAGIYNTKAISKTWKSYSDKNEAKQILKIHQYLKDKTPSNFKHDEQKNNTWIVHPNRKILHPKEIELNYKKPTNNISTAIACCDSGDRILIYDGTYELKATTQKYGSRHEIENDIMMVGAGNNVIITCGKDNVDIWVYASMYIENITFDWMSIWNEAYEDGNVLWLNNVKITTWQGIGLYHGGQDMFITNCIFYRGAVQIQATSKKANIEGCKFKKGAYIKVKKTISGIPDTVFLKCIRNEFENVEKYPIWQLTGNPPFVLDESRYVLKQNVVKSVLKGNIMDANKLYSIE